jgi:hypothetical protein
MQLEAQPAGERLQRPGLDVVVRLQALAFGVDQAGVAQLLEVVAERGLPDVEERHELAHAHLTEARGR